jgi:hypothetical protein
VGLELFARICNKWSSDTCNSKKVSSYNIIREKGEGGGRHEVEKRQGQEERKEGNSKAKIILTREKINKNARKE